MDGETGTYIPANLSDPHQLIMIAHRAEPEAQVIALVYIVACLLQCEILGAAIQVQWADW